MIEIVRAKEIVQKPALKQGVEKYLFIMNRLHAVDVSSDQEFQNTYRAFYQMRRFYSDDFARRYFKIMEEIKNTPEMSFKMALERIKHIQSRLEISFSSKMAHTINPLNPIWDSVVTKKHFRVYPPTAKAPDRERAACDRYEVYVDRFYDYMASEEGMSVLRVFDQAFPGSGISDVKKIDFVLWQDRENNKRRSL